MDRAPETTPTACDQRHGGGRGEHDQHHGGEDQREAHARRGLHAGGECDNERQQRLAHSSRL
ncbi:MAG TPA: hypothetical protein VG228_08435 [Solirubrobacteraceae bacterium]|nr:hypothetical protein [Solirubrobacteraceae bacterium]